MQTTHRFVSSLRCNKEEIIWSKLSNLTRNLPSGISLYQQARFDALSVISRLQSQTVGYILTLHLDIPALNKQMVNRGMMAPCANHPHSNF